MGILGLTMRAALVCGVVGTAAAQEEVQVQFAPGTSGATVTGTVVGDAYVDHVLRVQAGQTMEAHLSVTDSDGNGTAYFNVVPAGQDFPALYTGSMDDDSVAEVTFPDDGAYALRVYLMGNDRDTGKTVSYALDVSIP